MTHPVIVRRRTEQAQRVESAAVAVAARLRALAAHAPPAATHVLAGHVSHRAARAEADAAAPTAAHPVVLLT